MRLTNDSLDTGEGVACAASWSLLTFCQEFERTGEALRMGGSQLTPGGMLADQSVSLAFGSPDLLLRNGDFELALPVGEVLSGPANMAYLTIENCNEFKTTLQ